MLKIERNDPNIQVILTKRRNMIISDFRSEKVYVNNLYTPKNLSDVDLNSRIKDWREIDNEKVTKVNSEGRTHSVFCECKGSGIGCQCKYSCGEKCYRI
ncbi:hypothetical protein HDU92_001609 [Lobulomyces angularis]|nr:hypothetical protein HDU92_001609 [Lobulomyces angularis]